MPYQQTVSPCVVRLVVLRGLSPTTQLQCQALRAEAGRLWTDLLTLHSPCTPRRAHRDGG